MLMQMIDCLIEQDPSLSARRAIDVRRYIVNQWNRTHEESIDEDGVALFLCDENRGNLTDEQRNFARECREEIKACYPGNLPPHNWFTEDERKSRRKPWRFYGAWAVTSARSAGGFRGRRLTLFRVAKPAIDAVFGKTGEYPRC